MLILSICIGETLTIGDAISITLLDVDGGQVRIGIEAPRHIAIDREEVYLRKRSELEPVETPPEIVASGNNNVIRVIRKRSPLNRLYGRHNT